jgi:hypothetical protein
MSDEVQEIKVDPTTAPTEMDLLRAEVAALRAKVAPAAQLGRGICNGCGAEVKEGQRCETHPRETVNVCRPDGTFSSY